jgi:Transposase DDE domain
VLPNLITNVATTDATVTDNQMTEPIHDALAAQNLTPGQRYVDSGHLSAAVVVSALATRGIALIGPLLADTSAQARAGAGHARADFAIDYGSKTVTCPQGKTSASWTPCVRRGQAAAVATFSATDCGPCPARPQCATSSKKRRQLTILPRDLAEAQAAARARRKDGLFPSRLRPPRRGRRRHEPSRQPRSAARTPPRPAQDPPRTRVHGHRPQPPAPTRILDRHPTGPAANQPPGTTRTQPRRIENRTTQTN